MHHTCSVRGFKTLANLTKNSCSLRSRQFPFLFDQALQVPAFDKVHRDELRRAVLADIENPDDVFVDDRLCKEDFLFESLKCSRSSRHLRKDCLERHKPCELAIESLIHRSHAAQTEEIYDLVTSCQHGARGKCWCFFSRDYGRRFVRAAKRAVGAYTSSRV